jgi:hypothetical protein
MDIESIKEELNNYKDQRKNLWTTVVLLSGAVVGLFYKVCHFHLSINSFIDH